MKFLITGGAGFIGSCLVRYLINNTSHQVLNIDKLSYASDLNSVNSVSDNKRYKFIKDDICNFSNLKKIFLDYQPDVVVHLAAESHVDRSISEPLDFIKTNVIGTFNLLEVSRLYLKEHSTDKKNLFRFHHVSTDEVYGSLGETGYFLETTPYDPSSPYSATKASSDHLVRAWHRTFNLPISLSNCSNNYGLFQSTDKLIPLTIKNALLGKKIPIYGDGSQIRDWLHVEDHVSAIYEIITSPMVGETFNIGGNNEKTNMDVVTSICNILDLIKPDPNNKSYKELITFVSDRPGHDLRYAIDSSKIQKQLNWKPVIKFEDGLRKTIEWYLKELD